MSFCAPRLDGIRDVSKAIFHLWLSSHVDGPRFGSQVGCSQRACIATDATIGCWMVCFENARCASQSKACRRQLPNFHLSFRPGNSVSDVISSCTALAMPVSGSLHHTKSTDSQELGPLASSKSLKSWATNFSFGMRPLPRGEGQTSWATSRRASILSPV